MNMYIIFITKVTASYYSNVCLELQFTCTLIFSFQDNRRLEIEELVL